ncbi:ribosomal protein S10 [Capsaspora owczarzaki ATCC 30864]|uniref:Ribosomal protein S10 n=1 Tax=Capsaspora owczarzaki (strain ATCC 30864) TaxID=595528 RepID=A0A0D2WYU9_CAPO3|nr:ribosomal protein S10 [Capsaspora owczarzaki ATCC 30864]KJE98263.1 ribosomal protein S10 [Capsaspora owczarzaki ATCC 30864]|eukprot:XP_004342422.1 ribosomal protein S10 [Capsaspora owczarzaki ATCC 30864]
MLISKKNRRAVYEYIFNEGVAVAKKDYHLPQHDVLTTVPNLEVIKALQSLRSRGFVTEKFCWRHFYYYLTDSGVAYLRDYLNVPAEVVPATQKKVAPRPASRFGAQAPGSRPPRDGERSERGEYRRTGAGFGGDKAGADSGFNPEFRGGFGRGRGGAPRATPSAQ